MHACNSLSFLNISYCIADIEKSNGMPKPTFGYGTGRFLNLLNVFEKYFAGNHFLLYKWGL